MSYGLEGGEPRRIAVEVDWDRAVGMLYRDVLEKLGTGALAACRRGILSGLSRGDA